MTGSSAPAREGTGTLVWWMEEVFMLKGLGRPVAWADLLVFMLEEVFMLNWVGTACGGDRHMDLHAGGGLHAKGLVCICL